MDELVFYIDRIAQLKREKRILVEALEYYVNTTDNETARIALLKVA